MKRGAAGLIIIVLITLILIVIIFAESKFIMPNPQTYAQDKQLKKDAQNAIDQYQKSNIKDQTTDINP